MPFTCPRHGTTYALSCAFCRAEDTAKRANAEARYQDVEFFHRERHEPMIASTAVVGFGALLDCQEQITIGRDAFVGHRVMILTGTHDYTKFGKERQEAQIARPVTIEDGVWLASGVIVCPGVTIGEHAVVTAGSVVTSNVPAYTLVGGNPARKLRSLR